MKATDLMIGDWVSLFQGNRDGSSCNVQIEFIGEYGEVGIEYCEDYTSANCNLLFPIPLTAEILEKNGFELKGDGWLWCEDKDVETQNYSFVQFRRNGEVRIVEINFLNKAVTKFRNVQNVHELQHALRLCGIDKTIEI